MVHSNLKVLVHSKLEHMQQQELHKQVHMQQELHRLEHRRCCKEQHRLVRMRLHLVHKGLHK